MATSELFTADFWQRAITQATHFAAGGALSPLIGQQLHEIHSVPWQLVASGAGVGAFVSLCASLLSIPIPGTLPASFLPTKFFEGSDKAQQ
jgi:hypothetical protein